MKGDCARSSTATAAAGTAWNRLRLLQVSFRFATPLVSLGGGVSVCVMGCGGRSTGRRYSDGSERCQGVGWACCQGGLRG